MAFILDQETGQYKRVFLFSRLCRWVSGYTRLALRAALVAKAWGKGGMDAWTVARREGKRPI